MYNKNTDNIIFFQICVMFYRWHILIDTSTPKIDSLSMVPIPVIYDKIISLNNEISRLVVLKISLGFRRYVFWKLFLKFVYLKTKLLFNHAQPIQSYSTNFGWYSVMYIYTKLISTINTYIKKLDTLYYVVFVMT